jgi:hypothetical protein
MPPPDAGLEPPSVYPQENLATGRKILPVDVSKIVGRLIVLTLPFMLIFIPA